MRKKGADGKQPGQQQAGGEQIGVDVLPAGVLVVFGEQEFVQIDRPAQHAQVQQLFLDALPAQLAHVAHIDHIGKAGAADDLGLEAQVLGRFVRREQAVDQVDGALRIAQRVLPAAQAGAAKGSCQFRFIARQVFVREQHIAVKTNVVVRRVEAAIGDALLLQGERFVRGVAVEGVGVAVDQVGDLVAGDLAVDLIEQADLVEHGDQCQAAVARQQHDAALAQVLDVDDAAVFAHDQAHRRLLHDCRQGHHRLAGAPFVEQAAVVDAEVGLAVDHFGDRVDADAAGTNLHLQTFVAVVAEHIGHVVAGKLELVVPAQLQHDVLQVLRCVCAAGQQAQQDQRQAGGAQQLHGLPDASPGKAPACGAGLAAWVLCLNSSGVLMRVLLLNLRLPL